MSTGFRRRSRNTGGSSRMASLLAIGALAVVVAVTLGWLLSRGSSGEGPAANGEPVAPFQLPDLVSGGTFSLADYMGKKEVVVVSYMGWY